VYNNVRAAAKASGRSVAVMCDLQGPKIRLGRFLETQHELAVGDIFTITTEDVPGTKELVSRPTRVCRTTPGWATRS